MTSEKVVEMGSGSVGECRIGKGNKFNLKYSYYETNYVCSCRVRGGDYVLDDGVRAGGGEDIDSNGCN